MDLLGAVFIVVVAILVVASVSLGIALSRISTRGIQNSRTQAAVATGSNAQLDRIERSIREGTCIGVLAVSVAAIVAAGTMNVGIGWKLLLYVVGGLGVLYSIVRYYVGRNWRVLTPILNTSQTSLKYGY